MSLINIQVAYGDREGIEIKRKQNLNVVEPVIFDVIGMLCSIVVLWLTVCTCHSIVLPAADKHSRIEALIKDIFDIPDVIDNRTHIVSFLQICSQGTYHRYLPTYQQTK